MFIVNVEGAIYKGDKWLIGKRSEKEEHAGEDLSLIGGKVEQGEIGYLHILEETVQREILEEVDVQVETPEYLLSTSFITDTGIPVVNVVYLCKYKAGEAVAKDPDEVTAVYWMTTEEILNKQTTPDFLRNYIKQADEKKKGDPIASNSDTITR
ncbi:NUDIX domain-containing protein [Halomonas sp. MG34]|nr:NUDIX domain-containing protein [Halomonas sp. MG34]